MKGVSSPEARRGLVLGSVRGPGGGSLQGQSGLPSHPPPRGATFHGLCIVSPLPLTSSGRPRWRRALASESGSQIPICWGFLGTLVGGGWRTNGSHTDCPPAPTHSPIPAWRALYLDGLAEAALAQHLPVDEVRRSEDAVRPADHTEGLGATQVLALGGRGAQRAGARGPVDAAAPPGGTHPVPAANRWAPGRGPLGGRPGLSPAPFPLPAMPHRCQSMYSHPYSQKGRQRTALLGQS